MSLQYNVAGLLKEPVGATREYTIDSGLDLRGDGGAVDRISGDAKLLRTPRGVLVAATVQGTLVDSCSRCLNPVTRPIGLRLEEEFFQTVDIETGARVGEPGDPDDFRIDKHHVLDIEDAVRQYWSAALPMQVLCKSECQGLCVRCGADLNESPHDCTTEEDERWSALRVLAARREGN